MKKLLSIFIITLLLLFIQQYATAQKDEKTSVKKARVLPVYLVYTGVSTDTDTAIDNIVREAFTRHKVQLIDRKRFDELNENEIRRVGAQIKIRNPEFKSESEIWDAIAKEQRFVTNLLSIDFFVEMIGDSVHVTSAKWEATPSPQNVSNSRSSGKKKSELEERCCCVRDNVFALVDKILFSKWLQ